MFGRWRVALALILAGPGCGGSGGSGGSNEDVAASPRRATTPATPESSRQREPAPKPAAPPEIDPRGRRWGIVIHGGAGTINPDKLSAEREAEYRAKLRESVDAGYAVLADGGSSLDAVQAAIVILEDSPLFNAGKGAVFTHDGTNEMDASVMNGQSGEAGAVAGITTVKNPIRAARAVMEHSPHVMLAGRGAEAFCRERGLPQEPPEYFQTERRRKQLERIRARETTELDHGSGDDPGKPPDGKFGTVGAVAVDQHGHVAAGTSTGGMTNKRWGRIGDSPVIGAGTFADDDSCAVSATGHGEYFIREAAAHSICARMRFGGQSLAEAADAVIWQQLEPIGGNGGVIAITAAGDTATPFNTPGMYRAHKLSDGTTGVSIWKDDHPPRAGRAQVGSRRLRRSGPRVKSPACSFG